MASVEVYKQSIIKRYELAQAKQKGFNCHDAAYYLLGVKPEEYGLDGVCYVNLHIFEQTDNMETALLVAFGKMYENELNTYHLATLHPYDKTKVIHRDLGGYWPPNRPRNILWLVYSFFEQLTVGGENPMRIEELEHVQKRWGIFSKYLFTFKPEYFENLLSSLKST